MVSHSLDEQTSPVLSQQLLLSVVEELKQPFMNIARRAELVTLRPDAADTTTIQVIANTALQLIDNYALGVTLASQDDGLFDVEPVSISSVLYDAGSQLQPYAALYGVELDLRIDGKYGPVMAHRGGLQAALVSLGYALVEALPAMEVSQLKLQLSAYRCRYGVVAGVYCETEQITTQALRLGRQLYGRARQPLGNVSHTSGAGVFIADAILHAMRARLMASHHHNMHGLGTVLAVNPQLQFI